MRHALLTLFIVLSALAILIIFGKPAPAIDQTTQSAHYLKKGALTVQKEQRQLIDVSRTIAANGDYQGAPQRSFELTIWSPANKPHTAQPLLIYNHGFLSSAAGGNYLGEHFASHGYTVAAATFPLSNWNAPGGATLADVVNQPADVSFIIDTLLKENNDPQSKRYQFIDTDRIATAGLSLGGLTSTLVAFHPEQLDSRIAAAISIAGPSYMFDERFFSNRSLPFMMIASPIDAVIRHAENAATLLDKIPSAVLVNMNTASHAAFSSRTKWLRWLDNSDSIACKLITSNDHFRKQNNVREFLFGTPEMGVLDVDSPPICEMSPLPSAMNPLRQHQLTTISIASFLECHLALENPSTNQSCLFLNTTLANEIDEIEVISNSDIK